MEGFTRYTYSYRVFRNFEMKYKMEEKVRLCIFMFFSFWFQRGVCAKNDNGDICTGCPASFQYSNETNLEFIDLDLCSSGNNSAICGLQDENISSEIELKQDLSKCQSWRNVEVSNAPCKIITIVKNNDIRGIYLNERLPEKLMKVTNISVCFPYSEKYINCRPKWRIANNEYELRKDGTLYFKVHDHTYQIHEYEVCANDGQIRVCGFADVDEKTGPPIYFMMAGWIISDICLLAAFIVCVLKPGRISFSTRGLMCYMFSLFFGYLLLIINTNFKFGSASCVAIASALMWLFLTAFFWLNIFAFDLFRTFVCRKLVTFGRKRKCQIYALYAWIMPTVMVIVANLLDILGPETSQMRPGFTLACWFHNPLAKIALFYTPVAITLVANVVFFVWTMVALQRHGRHAALVNQNVKAQLLMVYIKLFVVMGITWIFEILSVMFKSPESQKFFHITDVINSFQGLFIFLAYTFKKETLDILSNCMNTLKRGNETPEICHLHNSNACSCNVKNADDDTDVSIELDTTKKGMQVLTIAEPH